MQVILREIGECAVRRAELGDLIPVMEINLKTLPEHYSDYFYESLLAELPEAFIVAEIKGKIIEAVDNKAEEIVKELEAKPKKTVSKKSKKR